MAQNQEDELALLRQQRLAALQAQYESQGVAHQEAIIEEQAKVEQAEAVLEAKLRNNLTSEARSRLTTVKMARPELANTVGQAIIGLIEEGRMQSPVDDSTLKTLLARSQSEKRESTIRRI